MDNIGSLIGSKSLNEPPEIKLIKDYVLSNFNSQVNVAIRQNQIIVKASSAALAGTLRMHSIELQAAAKTDKRIAIHISN